MLVQALIIFLRRGSYFSKALGRSYKGTIDPLSLHEVLEVSAGCIAYRHIDLPSSSSASKSKSLDKRDPANKHLSTFLTLKASPTPMLVVHFAIQVESGEE